MSSQQVIDSEKIALHVEQSLRDADREKHHKAAESALAKQHEAIAGRDGDFLTTDATAQLGRPLTRQQIIQRLSGLNPNLIFEQSRNFPHIGAVYVLDPTANLTDPDTRCRGRRHIVGMEWTGLSPEFTTRKIENDKWGKPQMKGQIRGWRTVLSRLIHARLISIPETERVFSIARGRESQRWFEEIH
jgi:hypothetical protein